MVTAPAKVEVRAVGAESFDDIYPLLLSFRNRKMSRDDWHRMLFSYPWWAGDTRGFALYADGVAVGFMGTIFSNRQIAGREETLCNASCWIVRKEYRSASILLLKPLLAMRDTTVVNLTPTVRSYEIFKKLGFKALETEQLLMAPIANPFTLPGGTYTTDPSEFEGHLSEPERAIHRGLATSPSVVHLMLRR
ncbi:MAG: hypothetical protein IAI50_20880, partial [Candidatus Eremiobacteraeota bacterium]|nr:hypothetical protein [Candidatus Eremiobacteraeota bacterium]